MFLKIYIMTICFFSWNLSVVANDVSRIITSLLQDYYQEQSTNSSGKNKADKKLDDECLLTYMRCRDEFHKNWGIVPKDCENYALFSSLE